MHGPICAVPGTSCVLAQVFAIYSLFKYFFMIFSQHEMCSPGGVTPGCFVFGDELRV